MIRRTFLQSISGMIVAVGALPLEQEQPESVAAADLDIRVEHCGACCIDRSMLDIRLEDCMALGGEWHARQRITNEVHDG